MSRRLRYFPEGAIVFVTDRCVDEAYLLLPDVPGVAAIVERAWRRALSTYDVELLVLVVMSNHWHVLLRSKNDPTAIPRAMQFAKSRVARAINELRGRHGVFWCDRYSAIDVVDDGSVVGRLWYTLHNPVKAGLCGAAAAEWPGLSTLEANVGVRAACGALSLPVSLPPAWRGLDADEHRAKQNELRHALTSLGEAVAKDRRDRDLPRPKAERVIRAVHWSDRPDRPARSRPPPCFASTADAARLHRTRRRLVEHAHRRASERFRAGDLDVEFPACTFPPRLVRAPNEARV